MLLLIFVFRPIFDLAWNTNFFWGLNLSGIIALFTIVLMIMYICFHKKIRVDRTLQWGMVYAFHIGVVTLINMQTYSELNYFLRLLSEMAFLLIVPRKLTRKELERCILLFLIATLVPIVITYLQDMGICSFTYFDTVSRRKINRGSGGYRQPSVLTRFCTIGLLYAFYLLERKKNIGIRIFLYVYMVMNVIAVFLSYHRTGYLLVVIIIVMWFYLKEKERFIKMLKGMFLMGSALIILFIIVYNVGIIAVDLSILESMFSLDNVVTISESGKMTLVLRGRGSLLEVLLQGMRENPWYYTFFGNGVNTNRVSGIKMTFADMEIIRVLWNGGILGGGIWLLHFGNMRIAIQKQKNNSHVKDIYRLATCMFWVFILWGITIETTNSPNLMYHVYVICGLLCNDTNVQRLSEKENYTLNGKRNFAIVKSLRCEENEFCGGIE